MKPPHILNRSTHIALIGLFLLCSTISIATYVANPEPGDCGPAINQWHIRHDNINQALACMKKGYKNVYYGSSAGIWDIHSQELQDYFNSLNEKKLAWHLGHNRDPRSMHLVISTEEGKKNAALLKKFLLEQEYLRLIWSLKSDQPYPYPQNDYLFGLLLGYNNEDIAYFYKRRWLLKADNLPPEIADIA